jgi:hypothetical protein
MKPLLVRINFAIRRLYCRIFGHIGGTNAE